MTFISEALLEYNLLFEGSTFVGICPITMYKNHGEYIATASHGEARILQGDGSDVSLTIPLGSQGVYMTRVPTDSSRFTGIIPKEECIIGPLVEVEHLTDQDMEIKSQMYQIKIPHCIPEKNLWKYFRVRHGNIYKSVPFQELPSKKMKSEAYYVVDTHYITIYTPSFSQFICTICKRICTSMITFFVTGNLELTARSMSLMKAKLYLCSKLYEIPHFQRVIIFNTNSHSHSNYTVS